MAENNKETFPTNLQLLVALANLGFFGLMFTLMHYFELVGADPAYFDDGTIANVGLINSVLGLFGLQVQPTASPEITTAGYAICYGLALMASCVTIMIAGRKRV